MTAVVHRLRGNPWAGFAVVVVATFVILVDVSIVNVAIPSIQRDLRASFAEIQLVVAGYQLAYAAMLITGGRLGDIFGRRRLFVIGLAGFGAASALCGASLSGVMLVGARLLQGLFAAVLYPQILSIIQLAFSPEARTRAFGVQGVVIGVAVVAGPLLGGALIQADILGAEWRAIFFVNVPIVALALPAAWWLLHESVEEERPRLDLVGAGLVTAGLACLIFPLTEGRELGWPAWAVAMLVLAFLLLAGFGFYQRSRRRRGAAPLIELSLLHNVPFVSGLLATFAYYSGLPSFSFTLSVFLQLGLDLTPLQTGLVFLPLALGSLAATYPATRLGRTAGKWAPIAGCALLVLGLVGVLVALRTSQPHSIGLALAPGMFVLGLGIRVVVTPLFSIVLSSTTGGEAGSASGVMATTQQIGGAFGVSMIGLIYFGLLPSGVVSAFERALLYDLGAFLVTALLLIRLPSGSPDEMARRRGEQQEKQRAS